MGKMGSSYIRVDAEVDIQEVLDELNDDELIGYLKERELMVFETGVVNSLDKIHHLRRTNKDYQAELDDLIYTVLGRIS